MNWFDTVILILIIGSVIYSLIRGLIKEVFALAALVGGFYFAGKYYFVWANFFSSWIQNPTLSRILSYILIFILVVVFIHLIGWIIEKLFRIRPLKSVNRILGAIFGFGKGVLICGIICLGILFLAQEGANFLSRSRFAPEILSLMKKFDSFYPQEMQKEFQQKMQKLEKKGV